MTRWQKWLWLLLSVVTILPLPEQGGAQGLYIYPARGQSPQQEESDKGQCYGWAVQQTGFNPADPQVAGPPPPPSYYPQPQAPQGGLLGELSVGRRSGRWAARLVVTPESARPSAPAWEASSA